jgi:hypothetical protein
MAGVNERGAVNLNLGCPTLSTVVTLIAFSLVKIREWSVRAEHGSGNA